MRNGQSPTAVSTRLEIDTGMGRLGFPAGGLSALMEELATGQYDRAVASVFTHLAASESPEHDAFTREQLRAYDDAYAQIAAVLPQPPSQHVLNTNGITRFPEASYDFVRLGIGLYGIGDAGQPGLRPVLRLTTRITAITQRPAGATVGYGRRGKLAQDGKVGVLAIGYADGLPRLAGNGNFAVLINGVPAPIIGTVCMDMTMVDLTGVEKVRVGDEAVVFGPEHPIEGLAQAAQTIPYEILTGIGNRVHRVYSQE
ncbi:MAG: alanine racemase [Bacteroidota bacterium]